MKRTFELDWMTAGRIADSALNSNATAPNKAIEAHLFLNSALSEAMRAAQDKGLAIRVTVEVEGV